MTTPYITLTIDQVRQIRKAIDDVLTNLMLYPHEVETLQTASKILSAELECLRYL